MVIKSDPVGSSNALKLGKNMKRINDNYTHMRNRFLFTLLCVLVSRYAAGAMLFDTLESAMRESVVNSIERYATNVTFAITVKKPNIVARADSVIPFAWRFGLEETDSIVDSRLFDNIVPPAQEPGLLLVYESDRHTKVDLNHPPSGYVGSPIFEYGICRIVFLERQTTPIKERFSESDYVLNAEKVPFERFFDVFSINRNNFMSEFKARVFKMCDGGGFIVDYATALSLVGENVGTNARIVKKKWDRQIYLSDVILNAREISEIVYWLWHRDGKVSKYPELCKRHPELFEPISGLDDFKTEIGRMLVERSKQ